MKNTTIIPQERVEGTKVYVLIHNYIAARSIVISLGYNVTVDERDIDGNSREVCLEFTTERDAKHFFHLFTHP